MRILLKNTKKKTKINLNNGKIRIKETSKTQRENMISITQRDAVLWDQLLD
jgi:hypothetical protein